MRLHEVLAVAATQCGDDPEIRGLALDSRQVTAGDLFLACRGTESHGLQHVDQAVQRGAVAVAWEPAPGIDPAALPLPQLPIPELARRVGPIASRFYGEPSREMFVMGVTGTDGKTSCAHLFVQAAAGLASRGALLGTIGFGFLDALDPSTHTTPDPVSLQGWLRKLADAGADALAMEVSSHALDQGRINGVAFDVAVFTNLGRDHLDYHGDLANYARAKRQLLALPELQAAVINTDDDYGRVWADEALDAPRLISYGLRPDPVGADWMRAENLALTPAGMAFDVVTPTARARLECGLLGQFNVYNLLAVAAAWQCAGRALDDIVSALAQVGTVPGRIEPFRAPGQPLVVVDYAHTPGALAALLDAIAAHRDGAGEIHLVFGCGGDRDRGKRPQMAAIAAQRAHQLILTDDNPRFEDAADIVRQMQAGLPSGRSCQVIHDRAEAIASAIAGAQPQDIVVIAGKGHETTQQYGAERRSFSDRQQVREALGQQVQTCCA